jgi:hypothetical protein
MPLGAGVRKGQGAAIAAGWLTAHLVMALASPARAEEPAELEGEDAGSRGGVDFVAPSGPYLDGAARRPALPWRACSFRHPICVHAASIGSILPALDAAERAWDVTTGALDLPAPDRDVETGAYDVYVVDDAGPLGATTALGARDTRSRIDRASAYTLIDRRVVASPCLLDTWMVAAVARASLFRAAPATDEGSARAETAYLARLAVPCALGDLADVDVFQAHPDRAIVDPSDARFDRGAQLFPWWLDSSYAAAPGALVRAMWSLAATSTPVGAARWSDEPDGFDVLRVSFKDALTTGSTIEDLYAEHGTTRALLGARDDGHELPEARALGDAIVPRPDWVIDWPTTPRRLAPAVPIAPTGSSTILVRRAGAPPGSRLRLEATWEQHAAIRWVVVKLDAAMHEMGRVTVGAPPRATEAQGTVANLDGVDALLVVAVNVGDPFAPFDPDDEVWEPHGWLLTLASE